MPSLRIAGALALACAVSSACAPLRVTPNALTSRQIAPQGATFFAGPAPELPMRAQPLAPVPDLPPLDGGARCGSDLGEQARAQCLPGSGKWGWAED